MLVMALDKRFTSDEKMSLLFSNVEHFFSCECINQDVFIFFGYETILSTLKGLEGGEKKDGDDKRNS